MAVKTKIGTSNIYDYDIDDTLNANGGSVSDKEDKFKAKAKVNPWSKHKPVVLSKNACQDFSSSKAHYVSGWWKGDNKMCGFSLSSAKATSWTALIGKYDGVLNGWAYVSPYEQDAPLRQNDFAGYYPAAQPIASGFYAPSSVTTDSTSAECQVVLPSSNSDSLSWSDFDTLKSYYFGILIYYSSNDYMRVTATTTLGNGGGSVKFDPSKLTQDKTYTVYPFICSNKYAYDDLDSSGQVIYTMPNVEPAEMQVKKSNIIVLVDATKNTSTSSVAVTFRVTNNGSAKTLNNNFIRLRFKSADIDDNMNTKEKEIQLSDGLVAKANATTTFTGGTFTNVAADLLADCRVWVSLNSGTYTAKALPMESGTSTPDRE